MEVEYKKDLKHNYMVIMEDPDKMEAYSIKMLEAQAIEGVLSVEQRRMDNKILLYYDITAKQAMSAILDKTVLSYEKVRNLCTGIIDTIEKAYEYLLLEDDFILAPEYIYMEVGSNKPVLCLLPGYGLRIKEQMSSFIEYLMNKVDYNDKEAVLLVYQLYADSREEGYTFDHLRKALQEKPLLNMDIRKKDEKKKINYEINNDINNDINNVNESGKWNEKAVAKDSNRNRQENIGSASVKKEDKSNLLSAQPDNNDFNNKKNRSIVIREPVPENMDLTLNSMIPIMMEKMEGEKEVSCYARKTYLYSIVAVAAGIFLIICSLKSKIIYNSYGSRIDYSKLSALLLIIFCVEGYLLKMIWSKKNKTTKIIASNEYADPRQEFTHSGVPGSMKLKKTLMIDKDKGKPLNQPDFTPEYRVAYQQGMATTYQMNKSNTDLQANLVDRTLNPEQDENPTCLLNVLPSDVEENITADDNRERALILKPVDELHYQSIPITEFPFFIGKLKKNVDYCLENEAISRYHAKITKEEDRFYITDLNSTNGTFVNSEAVQTYEKREIQIGDTIEFANISYQFLYK